MGAWGAGSFENDDASDWVYDLEASADEAVVRGALEAAASAGTDYLEAPDASIAVGAAELVAAARGFPASTLPDAVRAWVAEHGAGVSDELVALARGAVARVGAESELSELWDEAGDPSWRVAIDDLAARLVSAAPG